MQLRINSDTIYMVHFHWDRSKPGREVCSAAIHVGPCANKTRPCNTPGTGTGTVRRYVKDAFIKTVARRAALTQALANLGITRPTRRLIWDRYYQISRVPKARRGQ